MLSDMRLFAGHRPASGLRWCLLALLFILPMPAHGFWPFAPEVPVPASTPAPVAPVVTETKAIAVNEAALLHQQVKEMAADLFASLHDIDPENGDLAEGVIVCTFVDLKKLSRTSSFGRYVAEQLMGELQQRGYTVVELRKSNSVLIQEKRGEYGLSRDPAQIREDIAAGTMLTGTYTVTGDQIMVHAKIIDNRSAILLASATAIVPKSSLANLLLADSVSASSRKPEPIYMKRLEL